MNAETRHSDRPKQESDDLNLRAIVLGAAGVIATVLVVAGAARILTGVAGLARAGPTETAIERPKQLQSDPLDPRLSFEQEKSARLNGYGWVDREHSIAHIPIERAVQLRAADDAAKRNQ